MQAAAAFGPLLGVAQGTGARFEIENGTEGWTWALREGDGVLAIAPDVTPRRLDSLADVGHVRLAAGIATVVAGDDDGGRHPGRNDTTAGQAPAER